MTAARGVARLPLAFDRPVFQWDSRRGAGPLIVRLFGRLGERELAQIVQAVWERGRSPRDLVCIEFEQVTHLDYRALSEFTRALIRQQNRGADVCLVGLSVYLRSLFGVAGLGPALRRLEWMPVKEAEAPRRPLGLGDVISQFPARRRDIRR
ncbi:MAG: hypothetical protein E6K77_08455 [Candidatus Eisenbacteria bacterium]|uniref:STAS domain-containing protein n=1 Tax=Eiseniibacteriota bacterium TaxID=2212470 RepID=A0A538TES9_UNCEI|nr:MAG: hypothetical protein E6K74_06575 [Candidatus Eisenbacteria bacterium]TMQ62074.1 MAG: hypothetical protein E6K77_08455 [Candidatus Eisenbacteria bacterium]